VQIEIHAEVLPKEKNLVEKTWESNAKLVFREVGLDWIELAQNKVDFLNTVTNNGLNNNY
jgi:hypothetical protein